MVMVYAKNNKTANMVMKSEPIPTAVPKPNLGMFIVIFMLCHNFYIWWIYECSLYFITRMELVSYSVNKVSDFPVPSRDVTNQTLLPGIIKITNLFLQCRSSCRAPRVHCTNPSLLQSKPPAQATLTGSLLLSMTVLSNRIEHFGFTTYEETWPRSSSS